MKIMKYLLSVNLKLATPKRFRKVSGASIFGASAQIVPRAICRFERMWMPRTDGKGVEAARLLALQDSDDDDAREVYAKPSQNSEPGYLNVWTWNREHLSTPNARPVQIFIPEPLAREPSSDGTRIIKCVEGYEGQIWEDEQLKASRWWRSVPTNTEWHEFISGAEVVSDITKFDSSQLAVAPEVKEVGWRSDLTWNDINPAALKQLASPGRLLVALILILALPFGYLTGNLIKYGDSNTKIERQLKNLRVEVGDVLDLRRSATTKRVELEQLAAIGNPIELVDLLNELRTAMASSEIDVQDLAYDNESFEVRFTVEPELSLPDLATKLENSTLLQDVSANMGPGGVINLRAKLEQKAANEQS